MPQLGQRSGQLVLQRGAHARYLLLLLGLHPHEALRHRKAAARALATLCALSAGTSRVWEGGNAPGALGLPHRVKTSLFEPWVLTARNLLIRVCRRELGDQLGRI